MVRNDCKLRPEEPPLSDADTPKPTLFAEGAAA